MNKKRYWFYTYTRQSDNKILNGICTEHPFLFLKSLNCDNFFTLISYKDITKELEDNPDVAEYVNRCVENFGELINE